VKKVYDIFVSDSVELSVRRSAADQLVTILAGWCFLAYLLFSHHSQSRGCYRRL